MLNLAPSKQPSAEECLAKLSFGNQDPPSSCSPVIRATRQVGRSQLRKPKVVPSKISRIITKDARDIFGPTRDDLLANVRLQLMNSEVDTTNSNVETRVEIASVTKGKERKLKVVDDRDNESTLRRLASLT
jgi:hypothetical protein